MRGLYLVGVIVTRAAAMAAQGAARSPQIQPVTAALHTKLLQDAQAWIDMLRYLQRDWPQNSCEATIHSGQPKPGHYWSARSRVRQAEL